MAVVARRVAGGAHLADLLALGHGLTLGHHDPGHMPVERRVAVSVVAEMEPEARITEGLSLGSSEAEDCSDTVSGWLGSIGLAE